MTANIVVLQGVVKPDGTLELAEKVPLPAGKVQVTFQSLPDLPAGDPLFDLLEGIWAARARAGITPRTTEDVESQRRQLRDESEQEIKDAGRLQEECRHLREHVEPPSGGAE